MFSSYGQQLIVDVSLGIVLAVGLAIIYGHAGILSLCHAMFFGVGAYSAAFLAPTFASLPSPLSVLVTVAASGASGLLAALAVGGLCLPLRGDFVAFATLAFGELARTLALNSEFLGGARGLPGIPRLTTPLSAVLLAVAAIVVARSLLRNPWGRMMEAVRDNLGWARSLGIPFQKVRLTAFAYGGALAGAAGALFACDQQYVHPNSFDIIRSITLLLAVILGGRGNLTGCVLGATLVTLLPEAIRLVLPGAVDWHVMTVGALLVFTAVLVPNGLLGRWPLADPLRRLSLRARAKPVQRRDPPEPVKKTVLVATGLGVRTSDCQILNDIDLHAEGGRPLAIVGPNGSGKSTLAKALAGDIPASGRLLVGDNEVRIHPRRLRDRKVVLCVPQQPIGCQRMSALDNVRLALDRDYTGAPWAAWWPGRGNAYTLATGADALDALRVVGLDEKAKAPLSTLSYGQRKRALIAAALLARPLVLIFDEPFAGLNIGPNSEAQWVADALRARFDSEAYVSIVIDHRVPLLENLCPVMALLDGGQVSCSGVLGEMLVTKEFMRVYQNVSP